MKKIILPALLLLSCALFSQTIVQKIPCSGISNDADPSRDWFPELRSVTEADHLDDEADLRIKDSLAAIYPAHRTSASSVMSTASVVNTPVVGTSIAGNGFNNSTPCDNEIAIANNGHLISVQNSNIFRYRTATSSSAGTQSLAFWCNALAISAVKYDPKVLYDPEADRFIMVCLAGYSSGATNIVIGFSRSDTVNGPYNLYRLAGNPFNDTLWTDYPMIAVNGQELFVTGNLLHDNMSWQTGFVQTIIWQLNKWDGYNGDSLRFELHSNISLNGRNVRNLCPVESGPGVDQGPGMYFLSDRNLDPLNDTVFLVHVSDTANSPTQSVTVTPLVSDHTYAMPVNARESGGDGGLMATNDSRILGAFIENNRIQYVNTTLDTSTGRTSVYHGMISNVTTSPVATSYIVSDTSLYYGYPNIAYTGYGAGDNSAMIVFLHCDSVTHPGVSVIATDGNGNYSSRVTVKSGLGYVDVLSGDERWGDYSGIQRKYDVGGTCWVNGYYGTTSHLHNTWVAEIGTGADVAVPTASGIVNDANVYPNPFTSSFHVTFDNDKRQELKFSIYDMQGRLVTVLLEDMIPEGDSDFSFSTTPLAPGTYVLRIEGADGSTVLNKKVVRN